MTVRWKNLRSWPAVFVIFLLFMSGSRAMARMPSHEAIGKALTRTEKAFAGTGVRGDAGFLLSQAFQLTGRHVELGLAAAVAKSKDSKGFDDEFYLWSIRNDKLPRLDDKTEPANPGSDASFNPVLAQTLLVNNDEQFQRNLAWQAHWVFLIVDNVVKCKGVSDAVSLVGEPDYEYVATHQLLGIFIGADRGCLKTADLSQVASKYIRRVYQEMQLHPDDLSDLQLERAAILTLVGRPDLVPTRFITKLLATQSNTGFWLFSEPMALHAPLSEHTTALAYCVLSGAYGH